MESLTGYVEHIVYRNEENGYSVLVISEEGEEHTLTGILPQVSPGEYLSAQGELREHPVYGEQLAVTSFEICAPREQLAMERYLSSGAIRGVGEALAARIVKRFGEETLRILEEEPERLVEVKGISERMALKIGAQVAEKKDMRQAMMFLQDFGISLGLAVKIFERYGNRLYAILRENPYRLAEDIAGVGFRIADEIATRAGVLKNSEFRIRSGLLYTLQQAMGNGHLYLPMELLLAEAEELLQVEQEELERQLMDLILEKKLVCRQKGRPQDTERAVYLSACYYMELGAARLLLEMDLTHTLAQDLFERRLQRIEEKQGMTLDEHQREAVYGALTHGVFVMTGGPGTGKTTTIRAMLSYFEEEGKSIFLAAPTGRAAKRMSEATGREARTIHRMLEVAGHGEEGDGGYFARDEENPLEADVVIVDEMSMVDMPLFYSLLKALGPGTHLILVGDAFQLPSVGPGNVLRDIIASDCFAVTRLTRIFRQDDSGDIVLNAHSINAGRVPDLTRRSNDFLFIRREDANAVINACITLVKEKLPRYVKARPYEIQVLTPMRKGPLGVERLNSILQEFLNPPSPEKAERDTERGLFREGDKVMQIRNNYQLPWEIRGRYGLVSEQGTGVFNGDIGIVRQISAFDETLTVEFEEGRRVCYPFKELEDLELAYAITIHKSQGSEYPAIVLPLLSGPPLLMTRNLLYTGVTRAKTCVTLVGLPATFERMIGNAVEQRRYSGLGERLRECAEACRG